MIMTMAKNDVGGEHPIKAESQKLFLDFIGEPIHSPRRRQEGIYTSYDFGPEGQRVKMILLDTRYHRGTPYEKGADILGEAQWNWLEEELKNSRAQIHFVVSSISMLSPTLPLGEQWRNFPESFERFSQLVANYKPAGLLILTGDRHFTGLLEDQIGGQRVYGNYVQRPHPRGERPPCKGRSVKRLRRQQLPFRKNIWLGTN